MNYEKNRKYLMDTDGHYYAGLLISIIGVLLFVLGWMWLYIIPYQFFVALGLVIIGAIIAFAPSAGSANEDEFDREVKKNIESYEEKVIELFTKKGKKQTPEIVTIGNYIFDKEAVLCRKSRKDGKYRTSEYSTSIVVLDQESFCIYNSEFSAVSEEKKENVYEIRYDSAAKIEIETREHKVTGKNEYTVKINELKIKYGECDITIPVINSVLIDDLCDKIKIKSKK